MPKIIILIVTLLLMLSGFTRLGFWQLSRMHEKEAQIAVMQVERANQKITVSGTFDHSREVVLESQFRGRESGYRILTPLIMSAGQEVIVDRGWIPRSFTEDFLTAYKASGSVSVQGVKVVPPVRHGWIEGSIYGAGAATVLQFLDLTAIPRGKYPRETGFYVQATEDITPQVDAFLTPLPDAARHGEYALTWFSFALITLIGGSVLVYRTLRTRRGKKR